jgi:hypothetical protein
VLALAPYDALRAGGDVLRFDGGIVVVEAAGKMGAGGLGLVQAAGQGRKQ